MDKFEKLDAELMKGLSGLREKSVPAEIRRNFRRSVEERVLRMNRPAAFSWNAAILPVFVLGLAIGFSWFYLKPKPVRPVVTAVPTIEQEIRQTAPPTQAVQKRASVTREVVQPQIPLKPAAAVQESLPAISESELVSEIEMLKELGAWTEEDEAEIGIPSEQIFEELEMLAGEWAQPGSSGTLPQTSQA